MSADLTRLDASTLAEKIHSREVSAVEVAQTGGVAEAGGRNEVRSRVTLLQFRQHVVVHGFHGAGDEQATRGRRSAGRAVIRLRSGALSVLAQVRPQGRAVDRGDEHRMSPSKPTCVRL